MLGSLSRPQIIARLSISLCARSIASRSLANSPVRNDLYRPVPTLISKPSVRRIDARHLPAVSNVSIQYPPYSVAAIVEFSRQAGLPGYPPARKTHAPPALRVHCRCPLARTTRAPCRSMMHAARGEPWLPNVIALARPESRQEGKPHEAAGIHHAARRRGGVAARRAYTAAFACFFRLSGRIVLIESES